MRQEAEEAEEEVKHQFEIEECLTKINRYATITLSQDKANMAQDSIANLANVFNFAEVKQKVRKQMRQNQFLQQEANIQNQVYNMHSRVDRFIEDSLYNRSQLEANIEDGSYLNAKVSQELISAPLPVNPIAS